MSYRPDAAPIGGAAYNFTNWARLASASCRQVLLEGIPCWLVRSVGDRWKGVMGA